MTAADKDTIYIDIDDEITSIIDKVRASDGKIVALVLPKRASVLQSIVNMKLLKRAADDAKKHLVLVTTEASLMPLAGATGMMVAKTLTSKPAVPTPPQLDDDREETVDEDSETPDFSKEAVAGAAVGELAGLPPEDDVETLELDDDTPDPAEDEAKVAAPAAAVAAAKVKKDKKLHVPNFERFRLGLVLAVLAVPVLIILLIWALVWAPKATIGINTNAVNVNADFNLVLDTGAKAVDTGTNTVPAKLVQQQKTYTQQASATGQKNQGDKATGTVVLSSLSCAPNLNGPPDDISAGAGLSSSGLTFILQEDASFTHSKAKGSCITYSTDAVGIKAQSGGSNYNLNNATFSVAGYSGVTGTGSTSNGTDDIVKVVSQNDIDNAKSKINTNDPTVKQALANQLQQGGYFAVTATFSGGTPTVTTSANVGDTVDNVTVTEVVTYTMFGAREKDLDKLVDNNVASQIDTTKQTILSEGLSTASFNVSSQDTKTAQIALQTVATAGPDLDIAAIKQQAAGQKIGDVKQAIEGDPGVTGVNVKLSPFWVSSVPKKTSKITVTISKPTTPAKNSNGN